MYPGKHAAADPERPAFIMAQTGAVVTYAEFEARANRLAHLLRARGLRRLDHYAIFMENSPRYLEACGAGERAGLYYTCINSYLTAEELAYIVNNCEAKILITSEAKRDVALAALKSCPRIELCLIVDGSGDGERVENLDEATAPFPATPIADEALGTPMLYSSGTTGRPKGILRPLPMQPPSQQLPLFDFLVRLWRYRDRMIYLSPAPLYHSAPQAAVNLTIRQGGTAIIMERFDPEQYLQLVETYKVTHSQLVPTMFSRMLKLPDAMRRRYDLSSLEIAIHAAAPCPVQVKEQMIEWWGPKILEYYGDAVRRLALLPAAGERMLEVGAGLAWVARACKAAEPAVVTIAQDVSAECADACAWVDRYHVGELATRTRVLRPLHCVRVRIVDAFAAEHSAVAIAHAIIVERSVRHLGG